MSNELENLIFQVILEAGNARSSAMEALNAGRNQKFDLCEKCFKEAEESLQKAHELQSGMLFDYARGEFVENNILLSHAQDHLSMAIVTLDLAKEIIALRRERVK